MAYPSTFADVKAAVIRKARLNSTDDDSIVSDWVNQIYADVCVTTEANIQIGTMTLTANIASYTLPAGVLRIKEMFVTPVGTIQSAPLRMTSLDEILTKRRSSGGAILGGYITHYALLGLNDFEVYPTPAGADVITIYYAALPAPLSAGADVPILQEPYASKILEYGALAEAGDWKGDPRADTWMQQYEQWMQKYRSHLTRKAGGQPGQFKLFPSRQFPPHDPSTDVLGY